MRWLCFKPLHFQHYSANNNNNTKMSTNKIVNIFVVFVFCLVFVIIGFDFTFLCFVELSFEVNLEPNGYS